MIRTSRRLLALAAIPAIYFSTTASAQETSLDNPDFNTGDGDTTTASDNRVVRRFVLKNENGEVTSGELPADMDMSTSHEGHMRSMLMTLDGDAPASFERQRIITSGLRMPSDSSVTVSTSGNENSISIIKEQNGFWYVEDARGEDGFIYCKLMNEVPVCQNVSISK